MDPVHEPMADTEAQEKNESALEQEFEVEDIWTTGCALNTSGEIAL